MFAQNANSSAATYGCDPHESYELRFWRDGLAVSGLLNFEKGMCLLPARSRSREAASGPRGRPHPLEAWRSASQTIAFASWLNKAIGPLQTFCYSAH
eukprot:1072946-Amphidinium_carterae.1